MDRKIVLLALTCSVVACSPGTGARDAGSASRAVSGAATSPHDSAALSDDRPVVLFFGTSLTAGLGLSPDDAYPALIQDSIDAAHLSYRVVNAGVSGETSAAGLRRIDWVLKHGIAVFVLELGANDALRGQDLAATRHNLQAILDHVRARSPAARLIVAGMLAPPNLGRHYTEEFQRMFVDLAVANHAALIPFLLAGVAGVDSLNQRDGMHPNAAGARRVAENVWHVLERVLNAREAESGDRGAPTGGARDSGG